MNLVLVKCPSCGQEVSINTELESCFCMHCGCKIALEDTYAIKKERIHNPIENYLELARYAEEFSNYGDMEKYANKIIEIELTNVEAWFLKGKAAGWSSTIDNSRIIECLTYWEKAIKYETSSEQEILKGKIEQEFIQLIDNLFSKLLNNYKEHPCRAVAQRIEDYYHLILSDYQEHFCITIDHQFNKELFQITLNSKILRESKEIIETIRSTFGFKNSEQTDEAWETYIQSMDCSIKLVLLITSTCKDEKMLLEIYRLLITLEEEIIKSCSYKSNGHYYEVSRTLPDEQLEMRRNLVKVWTEEKNKVDPVIRERRAKAERDRLERLAEEKRKKEEEEAQRRYWAEHPQEHQELLAKLKKEKEEREKREMMERDRIEKEERKNRENAKLEEQIAALKQQIQSFQGKLRSKLFFSKAIEDLQKQVLSLENELKERKTSDS